MFQQIRPSAGVNAALPVQPQAPACHVTESPKIPAIHIAKPNRSRAGISNHNRMTISDPAGRPRAEDIKYNDLRKGVSNRRMETIETKMIEVVGNGETRSVPAGISLDRLLEWLEIDASQVAVELIGQIVRKPGWPAAVVHEGARIEVVRFVGGGRN